MNLRWAQFSEGTFSNVVARMFSLRCLQCGPSMEKTKTSLAVAWKHFYTGDPIATIKSKSTIKSDGREYLSYQME